MPDPALRLRPGFHGKMPARGDFVQAGLPRGFTVAWEAWLNRALPHSREQLGEIWEDCWLEAPIWHFALAAGLCGPDAVLGVWMPSVDRVGRHYPLTLAVCGDGGGAAFLEAACATGLDALMQDLPPDAVMERLRRAPDDSSGVERPAPGHAVWWTQGAPRVQPARRDMRDMPDLAPLLTDSAA
jgi:type VI secretion system protein ImpM